MPPARLTSRKLACCFPLPPRQVPEHRSSQEPSPESVSVPSAAASDFSAAVALPPPTTTRTSTPSAYARSSARATDRVVDPAGDQADNRAGLGVIDRTGDPVEHPVPVVGGAGGLC